MYRLANSGVIRVDDGILITRGHQDWPYYLAWLADGGVPAPPELVPDVPAELGPVPKSVSRFRARAVMQMAGILEAADTVVAEMHPLTRIAWIDAAYFRRDSPNLISVAQQLGLSNAQVDDFFRQADALEL